MTAVGDNHHNHFSHHIRTKGWAIEPGWKIVSHKTEEKLRATPESVYGAPHSAIMHKAVPAPAPVTAQPTDRSRFTHFVNGIGWQSRERSSSSEPRTRPKPVIRNIGITLTGPARTKVVEVDDVLDFSCQPSLWNSTPLNRRYRSGSPVPLALTDRPRWEVKRHSPPPPSPMRPTPSAVARTYSVPIPIVSSLPASSSVTSSPSQCLTPPGVLKKPGAKKGPKCMKKVAFLENTEYSRSIH